MNTKNNFREGFITTLRPFDFAEFDFIIPKLTILYAYIERPIIEQVLNEKGRELIDELYDKGFFSKHKQGFRESKAEYELRIAEHERLIYNNKSNVKEIFKGNIVQTTIESHTIRLYPEEYNVTSHEALMKIINGEEYLMKKINNNIFKTKEMIDKTHYLTSRGISLQYAEKLASSGLKDLVYYLPHPELQVMFCRKHEMSFIPDFEDYYNNVYGGYEEFIRSHFN